MTQDKVPSAQTTRARALRRNAPRPEKLPCYRLNNRQLAGFKFVRQQPIGPYFADFCCREEKLIIEIDGWTHASDAERRHDERRTTALLANGYRVVRFNNNEIVENIDGILETILLHLDPRLSTFR